MVSKMSSSTVAHRCHGKTFFSRKNLLSRGKTFFSRKNLLSHGKTYFLTAKLTFSRKNLLSHGKTYFLTAKLTFSRKNLLSHGKTQNSQYILHILHSVGMLLLLSLKREKFCRGTCLPPYSSEGLAKRTKLTCLTLF